MDSEVSQAILIVDAEMMGNPKYRYWAFLVDKLRTTSAANNSVWGIVADSEEENETLRNENETLRKKVLELENKLLEENNG